MLLKSKQQKKGREGRSWGGASRERGGALRPSVRRVCEEEAAHTWLTYNALSYTCANWVVAAVCCIFPLTPRAAL